MRLKEAKQAEEGQNYYGAARAYEKIIEINKRNNLREVIDYLKENLGKNNE